MRERMSASCLALIALVSSLAKCASGMVERSRCGLMNSAARGTETWVCASMVTFFGRCSRPGRPCLRAAVSAYLFQIVIFSPRFFVSARHPEADGEAGSRQTTAKAAALRGSLRALLRVTGRAFRVGNSKHPQVLAQHGRVLPDRGGRRDDCHLSGVEQHDIVGDVEHQRGVLLDQHDRQPALLQLADGGHDLVHDLGARPSEGSSISSTRGLPISARPIASICCSPPDRCAAICLARSCSRGNMLKTVSSVHGACLPLSGLRAATLRFSRTVRLLKTRRPCGTSATPRAATISGERPVTGSPNTATSPRRGGKRPTVTFMQVDLPAPLRPSRPSMRASPSSNDTSCRTWLSP